MFCLFPSLNKYMVVEKKPSSKSGLNEELVFGIQLEKYKNRENVYPSKSQTKSHMFAISRT